ncbi:acylphosphatase [Oceanobacillus sp. CFH 90083]|uniref:acylphosphatase n=1 Tax=Oceanobacillus sp. CFH 90083 TaxID=2592336 RepID=UPI00128BC429|nr:acylphosphatase [Oceanobacillus sp. CFH 90083]
MKYVSAKIQGRVQGVGFRYFTQHAAMSHDVVGWVKNEDDGAVSLEAYGEDENIDRFLEDVKKGPSRFAKVSEVDVNRLNGDPEYTSFVVRY